MRPIGSKSSYKENRANLKYQDIKRLIDDYSNMSNADLCKKYNISKSHLRNLRIEYKLKTKNITPLFKNAKRYTFESVEPVCGIYALLRADGLKVYIGSSVNIKERIKTHVSNLLCNTHYNKTLQKDWGEYEFIPYLIELCDESLLLTKENNLISNLDSYAVYNKNFAPGHDVDYKKLFEFIRSKITVSEDGCWEWLGRVNGDGYGVVIRDNKYFYTHRVAYMAHYENEAMLVGHMCNNKKCCNPEHLKNKSSRENVQYMYDSQCPLKRSSLYPHLDDIKTHLENGVRIKDIYRLLKVDVDHTTFWRFCKKVRQIYTL
jgi:hypothetical protein